MQLMSFTSIHRFIDEDAKEKLAPYSLCLGDESYSNRDLEKMSQTSRKTLVHRKGATNNFSLPKQVGNMYTASLYAAFASLIHEKHSALVAELIGFQRCMHSCLEYLEVVPWVGDEEEEKVLLWLL
ncbi:hypothetical protein Scep_021838 [Stephania cephalantha]|uniref:Hydroxymethylglutaryl-coenzyme A synthase C-terminal domain-containing protein n=1 Tax=Stephania cephalantha TaxID=152367 RepID=A0AAP0FEZ7_9MAGN